MPFSVPECTDCRCSSHQIIAAGGCPKRAEYTPAGRPLVPGQDATPRMGKDLLRACILVLCAWCAAITFALALGA